MVSSFLQQGLNTNSAFENPTAVISMIQQGLLTNGAFTVYLVNTPIIANVATNAGQFGLGISIPNALSLTNVDEVWYVTPLHAL